MMKGINNNNKGLIWASVALDATAGAQSVTATLPGGASGKPKILKAGGAVSALVTLQYGNNQEITAIVNPNAPADSVEIPSQASGVTQSVALNVNASAAGYVYIAVGFQPI